MSRAPLAIHLACARPIAGLAAWFGLVDRLPVGASRCAGVAAFVGASLIWHPVFTPVAFAAMLVSLVLLPAGAMCWLLTGIRLWRHPPRTSRALHRSWNRALAAAWIGLALLLPALFGWIWTDRVEWLVF